MIEILEHVSNFYATDDAPADVTDARLESRHSKKLQIAELQLKQMRLEELAGERVALDRRVDTAVAEHQAATATIQQALAEAEEVITASLAGRLPVPPEVETKRAECLARLNGENEKLEHTIAAVQGLKEKNERARTALSADSGRLQVALGALARPPLADPVLFFQREVLQSKQPWLAKWATHCDDRLAAIEASLVAEQKQAERFQREMVGGSRPLTVSAESLAGIEHARRIAQAANGELAQCTQRMAELHEQMVDE